MTRKKQWSEDMVARFPTGTFARIAEVLSVNEDRTDMVREAVEREIKRRNRSIDLHGRARSLSNTRVLE